MVFPQFARDLFFGSLRPVVHGATAEPTHLFDQEFFGFVCAAQHAAVGFCQSEDRFETFNQFGAAAQFFKKVFFTRGIQALAMGVCHRQRKLHVLDCHRLVRMAQAVPDRDGRHGIDRSLLDSAFSNAGEKRL